MRIYVCAHVLTCTPAYRAWMRAAGGARCFGAPDRCRGVAAGSKPRGRSPPPGYARPKFGPPAPPPPALHSTPQSNFAVVLLILLLGLLLGLNACASMSVSTMHCDSRTRAESLCRISIVGSALLFSVAYGCHKLACRVSASQ